MEIKKAVIPVAGFGTRFLPITKTVPKELLPIIDKPVIQYIVEEAVSAGLKDIILVISPEKTIIKKYFQKFPALENRLKKDGKIAALDTLKKINKGLKFSYAIQEKPLGTGHALLAAQKLVGNNCFAYFDGDAIFSASKPVISQVMDVFKKYPADGAVGGIKVAREKVANYGNLQVKQLHDREYLLEKIIEKPSLDKAPKDNLVVAGQRYVFSPKIFSYLKKQKPGVGGEIWLADAASSMASENNFYATEIAGTYYDTGNKLEYLKTVIDFALKNPEIKEKFRQYLKNLNLKNEY